MTNPQPVPSPAGALLGRTVLEAHDGRARVRYEAREDFLNRRGVIQGGFLAAMLDSAMGIAAATTVGDGVQPVTVEIKVSFLRPAAAGRLVAEARVVQTGRSLAFTEATLSTEQGEPVATATATASLRRPKR
jgi:uncharacterized protein (TIGR00369 family)